MMLDMEVRAAMAELQEAVDKKGRGVGGTYGVSLCAVFKPAQRL
jgi:hypothetical protein